MGEPLTRILFVVPPLTGHVNPTLAVAAALTRRGAEVAWCAHPTKVGPLLPDGARLLPLDDRVPADLLARKEAKAQRVRGLAALQFLWEEFLIPLARSMRPGVEAAIAEFRPDVCVVDQQAVGGALAARRCGVPWATFSTTSASVVEPLLDLPRVLEWRDGCLADLQREAGLDEWEQPDLSRRLVVVFSVPELVGRTDFPEHYRFVGPSIVPRPPADFPWEELREGPRVLISLGTVNAERGARFFAAAAEGLASEPLQVIAVTPESILPDPPENFLRRDWIPQLELIPRVDAVVCHGGHNTVCETLLHGRPLVVAPIKDDQPVVAGQVVAAGSGVRVKFGRVSASGIRKAVNAVLTEPQYREGAAQLAAAFASAGGPTEAANAVLSLP